MFTRTKRRKILLTGVLLVIAAALITRTKRRKTLLIGALLVIALITLAVVKTTRSNAARK